MKKQTFEESIKEIVRSFFKDIDYQDLIESDVMNANVSLCSSQLKQLFIDTMREVVGEDEKPDEYIAQHLTKSELEMASNAVRFHGRNNLRKEQRDAISQIEKGVEKL